MPRLADDPYLHLPRARFALAVRSPKGGLLQQLDARLVGEAARQLGAGREKAEDPVDFSAGILLSKKVGDPCAKGEVLATLYASDKVRLNKAQGTYLEAIRIGAERPPHRRLIRKTIG